MWRWAAATAIAAGVAAVMLLSMRAGDRPRTAPAPAQPQEPGKVRVTWEQPATRPAAPDAGRRAAPATAEDTVARELELLEHGDLAGFRRTLLPSVALSPDDFEACRRRVKQVPVRPDWEVAEESREDGHRVRRVSMFGKSMTGFHEEGGVWLADALWCLPVGLP